MVSIEFARPVFLWLALLIPLHFVAHFYFLYRTQTKAMRFANFETLKRISGERLVTKNITILVLRLLVLVLAIVALSGMEVLYEGPRNNFDYVIAIDTSSSMLASDIEPTRLEAAKSAAVSFLNNLDSSSSVGFVTFSGVTLVRNPLSTDYLDMRLNIASLNVSATSGTDISGAVITSANLFRNDEVGKAVILLTDGVNTVGAFVEDSISEAANYARSEGVVIYAVGLGTEDSPVGYLPSIFNISTSVDRTALDILVNQTGGQAVYPQTTEELTGFFENLDQQFTIATIPFAADRFALLAVFVLLSIEWILINLTFRRVA